MARRGKRSPNAGGQAGVAISPPPAQGSDSVTSSASNAPSQSTSEASGTDGNAYFVEFDGFQPDPEADFVKEFHRLAIHEHWSKKEKKIRRVEAEFALHYGTDVSKLEKWQDLCRDLKIKHVPGSITKCKKAIKSVHVNIFDFIEHRCDPQRFNLDTHKSFKNFREDMVAGKIFPLKRAKEGTFIKALLRPVMRTTTILAAGLASLSLTVSAAPLSAAETLTVLSTASSTTSAPGIAPTFIDGKWCENPMPNKDGIVCVVPYQLSDTVRQCFWCWLDCRICPKKPRGGG
ncbi:hypothetical protein P153DRAFT_393319 [Dothidotthia symphoricarpi CBS 119687]|uniref:Uncharacterized protein n=1 Tax=Dothidotthia symphoricarpi CBS 119687 TaxID=1392245 RepID=A0A6A6ASI9_9PLEO|nr:uncharacterized protein P153DRAFT_393319 [Dothidotthia symphoricarpi CBS 119687]KAF2133501.1 hypothetical protein P153DRAFT_393319 [Dothidotthia symphoricarpi CBS 119687]